LSPSLPPPICRTTSTRSLWTPSLLAASTPLARAGGTMSPAAVEISPLAMKSRRVNMRDVLLQVELGAGENREPTIGQRPAAVEHGGGVGADDAVELVAQGGDGFGKTAAAIDHGVGEVDPAEPGARRDPATVARPAGHGRRVIEDLVHRSPHGD